MRAPVKPTIQPRVNPEKAQDTYDAVIVEFERLFGPIPDSAQSTNEKFIKEYDKMTQFYDTSEYEFSFMSDSDQDRELMDRLRELRSKIDEILEIKI